MNSIDLIRDNLQRSHDIVLSKIDDMEPHCMVPPTGNGGCHTLWILGHLAYIESLIIDEFMLGEENQFTDWKLLFDGDNVSANKDDFPSFKEVLGECRRIRQETKSRIGEFEESDLDRTSKNVPTGAEEMFGDYRRCFQYAADHWFMHRGQLADARRAAGIERMWF